jgi:hypothetical protein
MFLFSKSDVPILLAKLDAGLSSTSRAVGTASSEVVRGIGLGLVEPLTAEAGSVLFGGMTSFLDSSSSIPSLTSYWPSLSSLIVMWACLPLHTKALAVVPDAILYLVSSSRNSGAV